MGKSFIFSGFSSGIAGRILMEFDIGCTLNDIKKCMHPVYQFSKNYSSYIPNVAGEWLALLLHILVLKSQSWDRLSSLYFSWFFSVISGKYRDSSLPCISPRPLHSVSFPDRQ
jgi:hypothetical protein